MADRLAHFTRSLRERSRLCRLGSAPALLVLPEGPGPWPLLLWLHGRTVSKEVDSARYLRLLRAGIATCALDLPGHGERLDPALQAPEGLPALLSQALEEVDPVLDALRGEPEGGRVSWERLALGGMSAGGMVTLRRLCDPHPFRCAAVEATAGDFLAAARDAPADRWAAAALRGLDPVQHLEGFAPLPLLALHSERDELAPLRGMTGFVTRLRERYVEQGAEPDLVRLVTFPETGAPYEHAGFGRRAGEARRLLLEFLGQHLAG